MIDLSSLNIIAEDNSAPEFTLLPKGYYKVVSLKVETKETKSGDGTYIYVEFEVIDQNQYQKRKIFCRYNIANPSNEAVEIARKNLSQYAWAIGLLKPLSHQDELLLKELTLYVDIKNDKQGKPQQVVTGYYPASWNAEQIEAHRKSKSKESTGGGVPPSPVVASAPVGAAASPWARK